MDTDADTRPMDTGAGSGDTEAEPPPVEGGEPEPGAPPSLPLRVVQVFVSPGRLFAALREDPKWLGALLFGALLVVLSTLLIPGDVWNEMFRRQMLQSGRQMPEGIDFGAIQRVAAVIGGAVFWFVWAFVIAGVTAVIFSFILGDEGRYRQYLSVTAHALLIPALGGLATVPLRIARRDPQLSLNLGLFVPGVEGTYLGSFLTTLDLFLLWGYVVIALGVHQIDRNRSWGSAAAVILCLALLMSAGLAFLIPR